MITDCEPPPRVEFRHLSHKSLVEFKHFSQKLLVSATLTTVGTGVLVVVCSVLEIEGVVSLVPRVVYSSAEFEEEGPNTRAAVLLMPVASPLLVVLISITAVLVGATLMYNSTELVVGITAVLVGATLIISSSQ